MQCESVGGSLASIANATEQSIVGQLSKEYLAGQPDAWLGASDIAIESAFAWTDGTVMSYSHWRSGEPNNGNGAVPEDCMVIEGDAAQQWDDRRCDTSLPSICKRLPGT